MRDELGMELRAMYARFWSAVLCWYALAGFAAWSKTIWLAQLVAPTGVVFIFWAHKIWKRRRIIKEERLRERARLQERARYAATGMI